MFWAVLVASIILVVVIVRWLYKKTLGVPLLKVTVGTTDGRQFLVAYEKLHPDVAPVEYVRLVLGLAPHFLNVAESTNTDEVRRLIDCIRMLGTQPLSSAIDLSEFGAHPIVVAEGQELLQGNVLSATLGFRSEVFRATHVYEPRNRSGYQLLHTWLAVISTSIPKLNDGLLDTLRRSLRQMASLYDEGRAKPSDISALFSVSNAAFNSAVLEERS